MAYQHGDYTDRSRIVSIKHVLQGGVDGLGRKTQGRQDVGPPANLLQDRWTATMRYQFDTPHKHGLVLTARNNTEAIRHDA